MSVTGLVVLCWVMFWADCAGLNTSTKKMYYIGKCSFVQDVVEDETVQIVYFEINPFKSELI
jgi:hypothetical protein